MTQEQMVRGIFYRQVHNSGDGFVINHYTLLDTDDMSVPEEIRETGRFSALGYDLLENNTMITTLKGEWKNKAPYGYSFHVTSRSYQMPTTQSGIIDCMGSGFFKGIGPKTAQKIYAVFGDESLDIILHETSRLQEVSGIGGATVTRVQESVEENEEINELMEFLGPYGVKPNKIRKIRERFPEGAVALLTEDPFRLCEIHGFGFETTDKIAVRLNTPLDSPLRLQSALWDVLLAEQQEGHLYTTRKLLLKKTKELVNHRAVNPEDVVQESSILAQLDAMRALGSLVETEDGVYTYRNFEAENGFAHAVASLCAEPLDRRLSFSDAELEREIAKLEKETGITPSKTQREAIGRSLNSKVSVITGGPGTGKSTILRFILQIFQRNAEYSFSNQEEKPSVLLMAPTGRAARRMTETTDYPAFTIHKGIGLIPGCEDYVMASMIEASTRLVIVDESSMIGMQLAWNLLSQIPSEVQVIFLGDVDQLESVEAGNVLRMLIDSETVPVTRLDVIFRQDKNSLIVKNAHRINNGDVNLSYGGQEFIFRHRENEEEAATELVNLYLRAVGQYGLENVMVLCPRRSERTTSAAKLNKRIQKLRFGHPKNSTCINYGSRHFFVGDRVMQTRNTNDCSNGDLGICTGIFPEPDNRLYAEIHFDFQPEGKTVEYHGDDFENLELAYSCTIHKSQGSEFRVVLIPVLQSQVYQLRRNLIYTAVTRGKEVVVLVGSKETLASGIRKTQNRSRRTVLDKRLQKAVLVKQSTSA